MQCPLCGSPLTAPNAVCPRCHGTGVVPPQSATPAPAMMPASAPFAPGGGVYQVGMAYQSQQWYFSHAGGQFGPVPGAQIPQLIQQGQITPQTMVWRQGLPNWYPASRSELAPLFGVAPPIPFASGAPSPQGFVNPGYNIPGYDPVPKGNVHDGFAWGVAFGPLWGTMLLTVAAALLHNDTQMLVWGVILVSIALLRADLYHLKKAGYETNGLRGWAVLRPVYLFRRASLLNRSNIHAWVWIGLFATSIVLAVLLRS